MKKLVALLLSVMMCFACVSALADTYVSWYTYGDVYLSSVRSEMEADFAKLNLTINGSDANGNQQVQSDFISTALMNNDCEAIVVNLVESGAISTAQTIMNQIQAAGIPTVWFNRPVSTNNEEAANLFLNNPASAFVGTNFEDAGVMQGELIGQYLVEHYNDIDLNGDGKISYIMFKGDEANQEAIARTALAVEYANKALVAAASRRLSSTTPPTPTSTSLTPTAAGPTFSPLSRCRPSCPCTTKATATWSSWLSATTTTWRMAL